MDIEFTPSEKAAISAKLQVYLAAELNVEIGRFDAEFLLDFISRELGVYYYNQGLYDAQAVLLKQNEDLTHAIYQLEKPTDLKK